MAQKLTITANSNNNGNGANGRKKAKKAKKELKQFADNYAANAQSTFDGMGNGPKIDKLRDLVLALIDQNINLIRRVEDLETQLKAR